MRVRVDKGLCIGDETCVEISPEVFEMDGDVAVTKMEDVPQELEGHARRQRSPAPPRPLSSRNKSFCYLWCNFESLRHMSKRVILSLENSRICSIPSASATSTDCARTAKNSR